MGITVNKKRAIETPVDITGVMHPITPHIDGVPKLLSLQPSQNSVINQLACVFKRFGRKLPDQDPDEVAKFCKYAKLMIDSLPRVNPHDIPTFEEWLDQSSYTGAEKAKLRAVFASEFQYGKKTCVNKSFIKSETYMDPDKAARGINSYVDESKVDLGPFQKAIDKALFGITSRMGHRFFEKGLDPATRPQRLWDLFGTDPVFSTDFSSFECHHRDAYADIINYWMQHSIQHVPYAYAHTFLQPYMTKGRNVSKFKSITARVDDTLMSGAMWTSSANSLLNFLICTYLCASSVGVAVDGMVDWTYSCYRGKHEGDDGIFYCPADIEDQLVRRLGLLLKFEGHDMLARHKDFSTAAFCGILCDINELAGMTDAMKALSKFFIMPPALERSRRSKQDMYLRCKALSYKHAYANAPIIGPLMDEVLYRTKSCDARGGLKFFNQYHRADIETHALNSSRVRQRAVVTDASRQAYAEVFHISPQHQRAIESKFFVENTLVCFGLTKTTHDIKHCFTTRREEIPQYHPMPVANVPPIIRQVLTAGSYGDERLLRRRRRTAPDVPRFPLGL